MKSLIILSFIILFACEPTKEKDTNGIKYIIEKGYGWNEEIYYSVSEIEYLKCGCIKFLGFAWGKKDTTIVCGSYSIKKYR